MKLTNEEKQDIKNSIVAKFKQALSDIDLSIDRVIDVCSSGSPTKEDAELCAYVTIVDLCILERTQDGRRSYPAKLSR